MLLKNTDRSRFMPRKKKLFKNSTRFITSITVALFFALLPFSSNAIPTHCKANEFTYVTAQMYEEINGELGFNTEKILSLCADKRKEPFAKFIYRYGKIGKVELESIATAKNKFSLSSLSDSGSHSGELTISFAKGQYIYMISEALGMSTFGFRLYVYKSHNAVVRLMSSQHYVRPMIMINFEKASSPIFEVVAPVEPW